MDKDVLNRMLRGKEMEKKIFNSIYNAEESLSKSLHISI